MKFEMNGGTSLGWRLVHCFHLNWNFEVFVFVDKRKPELNEKNPRIKTRVHNKLNVHMKSSSRSNASDFVGGERSPLHQSYSSRREVSWNEAGNSCCL